MSNRTRRVVAVLGAVALTVPSAAVAAPGNDKAPAGSDATTRTESKVRTKGESTNKGENRVKTKGKGKGKAKKVKLATYILKGVYDEAGQVDVTGGNSHAKRAGLIRANVALDLTQAKLVVADTDNDGEVTVGDFQAGDKVTVQLKLPRTLGAGPYAARKLVDRTHPPVDASETGAETDAPVEAPTDAPVEDSTSSGAQAQ